MSIDPCLSLSHLSVASPCHDELDRTVSGTVSVNRTASFFFCVYCTVEKGTAECNRKLDLLGDCFLLLEHASILLCFALANAC